MDVQGIQAVRDRIRAEIHRVVVGLDEVLDLMLVALLADGHILLEGVPGTAKTLLARAFAASLSLSFNRIQFTPDLMPGDVLGTNLFNFQSQRFSLTKGPIFTQVLLADEVNRTPPKTQSALLQAMQERHVTLDGQHHALGSFFMVLATQNPIEQEGTYPLPEAQLDRFLFKVLVGYPDRDGEREIVRLHGVRGGMPDLEAAGTTAVVETAHIEAMRATVSAIPVADPVADYIVDIVRATRTHAAIQFGASPRASSMLALASRAMAALQGRDYVIPDDVKALALPALRHRLVLAPGSEIEGVTTEDVVRQVLESIPAPR